MRLYIGAHWCNRTWLGETCLRATFCAFCAICLRRCFGTLVCVSKCIEETTCVRMHNLVFLVSVFLWGTVKACRHDFDLFSAMRISYILYKKLVHRLGHYTNANFYIISEISCSSFHLWFSDSSFHFWNGLAESIRDFWTCKLLIICVCRRWRNLQKCSWISSMELQRKAKQGHHACMFSPDTMPTHKLNIIT